MKFTLALIIVLLNVSIARPSCDFKTVINCLNQAIDLNWGSFDSELATSTNSPELKLALKELKFVLFNAGQSKLKLTDFKIEETQCKNLNYVIAIRDGYQNIYSNTNTTEAFDSFNKALIIAKEQESTSLIKFALRGILEVYDFELILSNSNHTDYLEEYKRYCKSNPDLFWYELYKLKQAFHRISNSQHKLKSLEDFDVLMAKFPDDHKFWALYLSYKAVILEFNDDFDGGLVLHEKTVNLINDEPYLKYAKFRSFYRMMIYNYKRGNLPKSKTYLDSLLFYNTTADTIRAKYYASAFTSEFFYASRNFKKAYDQLEVAREYEIKMDRNLNSIKIAQANVKYQTAEKEKENLILTAQKVRNQNIALGLGGSLVLGSIITLLVYRNAKRKQHMAEQEKKLQQQKMSTTLKEQEINTINAMVEGQEKERLRLARDLHDNLGGTLAAIKMHIGNLQHNLHKTQNPNELLDKASSLISEAYKNVRNIAHERNSGVIAKEGLLPAVQKLAHTVSVKNRFEVTIEEFGLDERLSNNLEITIFRIIQELITNIIKHAEATEASVSLTQHENELNIMVEDNGKGFKVGKLNDSNGMGLGSIERRVEHLEGTMEVDSTIGKGTSIIIDIPI